VVDEREHEGALFPGLDVGEGAGEGTGEVDGHAQMTGVLSRSDRKSSFC